jgi:uncharacterized protein
MNPVAILESYYDKASPAYRVVLDHGRHVAAKALAAADRVHHPDVDRAFIEEAALLHDIGILYTDAPALGCRGRHPYVCHGYLGRTMLERCGLHRHALVCERHVGVGITQMDIISQKLPIPLREMMPVSVEEQIICYADKFFSKNGGTNGREKSVEEILQQLQAYGPDKVRRFERWVERFGD